MGFMCHLQEGMGKRGVAGHSLIDYMINYVRLWASVITACHMRLADVTESFTMMACQECPHSARTIFQKKRHYLCEIVVFILVFQYMELQ